MTLRFLGALAAVWTLLLAAALAGLAWWLSRRETRGLPGFRAHLIPILRATAVFWIVFMLAGPVLHHRKVIGSLARLFVVVDASDSMAVEDPSLPVAEKLLLLRALEWIPAGAFPDGIHRVAASLESLQSKSDAALTKEPPADTSQRLRTTLEQIRSEIRELSPAERARLAGGPEDAKLEEYIRKFESELLEPANQIHRERASNPDEEEKLRARIRELLRTVGKWAQGTDQKFASFAEEIARSPEGTLASALRRLDTTNRWERARTLLLGTTGDTNLLARLASKHDVTLVAMRDTGPEVLWRASDVNRNAPTQLSSLGEPPAAPFTDLAAPLAQLAGTDTPEPSQEEKETTQATAILLLTDGQHNSSGTPLSIAGILGERRTAVYPVGFGPTKPPPDLAILSLRAPSAISEQDRLRGSLEILDSLPAGSPFVIRILHGDTEVWRTDEKSTGSGTRKFPFDIPMKEVAERLRAGLSGGEIISNLPAAFTAEIIPLDAEARADNNTRSFTSSVIIRKRKVLIAETRPRWDFRYLRNLLERDGQWEVNVLPIASSKDGPKWLRGEAAGTFPNTQARLDDYDLMVLGDCPPSAFTADELGWIAQFVTRRGGGLILIDGPRMAMKTLIADSPLATLSPVTWQAEARAGEASALKLTSAGTGLAALALGNSPDKNAEAWAELPPPKWIAPAAAAPGSEVLVEAVFAEGTFPAMVLRRSGAGRVLYVASDESWRWRYQTADTHHTRFWAQAADWIGDAPFSARNSQVALDAGEVEIQPGARASIRAQFRSETGERLTDGTAVAVLSRDGRRVSSVRLAPDESGTFLGTSPALDREGDYTLTVETSMVPSSQLDISSGFSVRSHRQGERAHLDQNEGLLREIASASGGQFLREDQIAETEKLLEPLSAGTVIESETVLWQSWWWFLPAILLLAGEWILRKRAGLL